MKRGKAGRVLIGRACDVSSVVMQASRAQLVTSRDFSGGKAMHHCLLLQSNCFSIDPLNACAAAASAATQMRFPNWKLPIASVTSPYHLPH